MTRVMKLFILTTCFCTGGCMYRLHDVTNLSVPRYQGISGNTFITIQSMFLVEDRGRHDKYILPQDSQELPLSPQDFGGEEIRIDWGKRSFITAVIQPKTSLLVEKIEYSMGVSMNMDVIHARVLSPPHSGEVVRIEHLFIPSDRSDQPILPDERFIRQVSIPAIDYDE